MNLKKIFIDFATTFVLFLVVTAVVTFLYSLVVHGAGRVDWEQSFRMAIIFGIALPWLRAREKKEKEKTA